jgi:hypothetical protein
VDVVARYWLPIDADATRKDSVTGAPLSVVSSTDAEKARIAQLMAQVRDWLVSDMGWPEPAQVNTGNGYADFYALPGIPIPRCPDPDNPGCLKYDAAADTLIRDVIHALSYKFTGELGSIDDAVFNPSRIMKVPGTWARKAKHTPDRPHRQSKLIYIPTNITHVTVEQLQLVADHLGTTKARTKSKTGQRTAPSTDQDGETPPPYTETESNGRHHTINGPVEPQTAAERAQRLRRARNYLARVPAAISGQKGHDSAFVGLGKVIRRFALTREMALEAIVDWNNRCEPPWNESELAHKLDDIYGDSYNADDWGQLLTTPTDLNADATRTDDYTNAGQLKPTLEISTKRDRVVDAALDLLPRDPDLYLLSNVLVNIVRVAEEDTTLHGGIKLRHALGTHLTNVVDADQLSYHLTRTADCYCWKQTKQGDTVAKPAHPPDWLLRSLIKFAVKAPLRPGLARTFMTIW